MVSSAVNAGTFRPLGVLEALVKSGSAEEEEAVPEEEEEAVPEEVEEAVPEEEEEEEAVLEVSLSLS